MRLLCVLLPGDILLGTEDKVFTSLDDLSKALEGSGPRQLRLRFLRGDYSRVRRVTVQLGNHNTLRKRCGSVIRVFIVAASPLSRASLQSLLRARKVEVVGSAPDLESLWDQPPDVEVDIVLVEASGDRFEGMIDSLNQSQLSSEAAIVVLSDRFEPGRLANALRAGVRAVLPSDTSPDQIVAALEAAAAGLIVLHPADVDVMFPAAESTSSVLAELIEPLTPRESEVLQMLASGLANKEIATRLAISDHTVKFHVASILGKLGAASRTEAVTLGIRRGLVLL